MFETADTDYAADDECRL